MGEGVDLSEAVGKEYGEDVTPEEADETEAREILRMMRQKYCSDCGDLAVNEKRLKNRRGDRDKIVNGAINAALQPLTALAGATGTLEAMARFVTDPKKRLEFRRLQTEYAEQLDVRQTQLQRTKDGLCQVCGEKLDGQRNDALTCSDSCKNNLGNQLRRLRQLDDALFKLVRDLEVTMPPTQEITVACDRCGYTELTCITHAAHSLFENGTRMITEIDDDFRAAGWSMSGGKHLCPSCASSRR